MIINVGSLNKAKCQAVEEVCHELFGEVTVNRFRVRSGVSHTPTTDDEILRGAVTRATEAFRKSSAALGIGLEGGITPVPYGHILKGWAAVFDGTRILVGSTPGILLPPHIMEKIGGKRELAHVMDEVSGREDVRSNEGAFGILTGNRISRTQSFILALYCALAPIVNSDLYSIEPATGRSGEGATFRKNRAGEGAKRRAGDLETL